MILEKIYTQEDLNNAITKSICEMTEVLKCKEEQLEVYKKALFLMSEDFAHAEYILDDLLNKHTQRSKAELVHEYVCKARNEE